jgi:hypothetical protein
MTGARLQTRTGQHGQASALTTAVLPQPAAGPGHRAVPTVVLPFVNTALASRAPFRRSVDSLRRRREDPPRAPAASCRTRRAPAAI